MKNILYSYLLMLGMLTGCSSQKKLTDEAPFKIGAGFCQEWIGGKEESGKGLLVKIPVSEIEGYKINAIFFRGQQAYTKVVDEDGQKFVVAELKKEGNNLPSDMILHADPKKEFGNKPSGNKNNTENTKFASELSDNEAVLSYIKKSTIKYVKVSGIKDKPALIYPTKSKE